MFLSKWQGFTEFIIPRKGITGNLDDYSIDTLPSKTNIEIVLRNILINFLSSIIEYSLNTSKKIELRATDLALSFSSYPDNIVDKSWDDSKSHNAYVSHIDVFLNMYNSRTRKLFDFADFYVLVLMLIHEAMRLEGEDSTIAAIEATETKEILKHIHQERFNKSLEHEWKTVVEQRKKIILESGRKKGVKSLKAKAGVRKTELRNTAKYRFNEKPGDNYDECISWIKSRQDLIKYMTYGKKGKTYSDRTIKDIIKGTKKEALKSRE